MGIRARDDYDGSFELPPKAGEILTALLGSETFCKQVVRECRVGDDKVTRYTGLLFQPVPWSLNTPKGMAKQYEQYHGTSQYQIVNVPPNFMFQANVTHPPRLCAIFEVQPVQDQAS